jgi:hypothetical protein
MASLTYGNRNCKDRAIILNGLQPKSLGIHEAVSVGCPFVSRLVTRTAYGNNARMFKDISDGRERDGCRGNDRCRGNDGCRRRRRRRRRRSV